MTAMPLSFVARTAALVTALLAAGSLALQFVIVWRETGGSVPAALWIMARYFTILTNALAAGVFAAMALTGRAAPDRLVAGLVLWIAAVGLVYHALLATLWEPQGLRHYADQGLHSAVPLAVVLWWAAFTGRARLSWLDPLLWMIWPVAYLTYALIRGHADGIFPYPFLDPARVGQAQLVWNVSRLLEGFFIGGYLVMLLSSWRRRQFYPSASPASSRR